MRKGRAFLVTVAGAAFFASSAWAGPIALDASYYGVDSGLDSRWVNTSYSPHSVGQAAAAMSLGVGDVGYESEANLVVDYIDFADGSYLNAVTPSYLNSPLGADDDFAVEYSGYIDIGISDTYSFRSYTDDGFQLSIGGDVVSQYTIDRPPGVTTDSVYLASGLYEFSFLGWEQGGAFVNELTWQNSLSSDWSLVRDDVLYRTIASVAVFEPSVIFLFGSGLLGVFAARRQSLKRS